MHDNSGATRPSGPRAFLRRLRDVLAEGQLRDDHLQETTNAAVDYLLVDQCCIYEKTEDDHLITRTASGVLAQQQPKNIAANIDVFRSVFDGEVLQDNSFGEKSAGLFGVKNLDNSELPKSVCAVPIYREGSVGGVFFVSNLEDRSFGDDEIEALLTTATILSQYLFVDYSVVHKLKFRDRLVKDHRSISIVILMIVREINIQVEERRFRKPNDFASDQQAQEYDKATEFLEYISRSLISLSESIVENDQVSNNANLDNQVERVFGVRDSIGSWLEENGSETVDVIARVPVLAGIIAALSLVNVPPTTSMIAAMAIYSPKKSREYISHLIKKIKE